MLTVLGAMQAPIVYADGSTSQQVFDASYNQLTGSLPPFLANSTVASFIKSEIFLQVGWRVVLWCLLHGTDAMQPCYPKNDIIRGGATMECHANPPLPLVMGPQWPSGSLQSPSTSLLQQHGYTSSHAIPPSPCQWTIKSHVLPAFRVTSSAAQSASTRATPTWAVACAQVRLPMKPQILNAGP